MTLAFLTKKAIFQTVGFFTQIRKNYAIFVIYTKNKNICETGLINMLIWADEACHFSDFSNITSLWHHNDILLKI